MLELEGSVPVGKGSRHKEEAASIDKGIINARAHGNSRMGDKLVGSF